MTYIFINILILYSTYSIDLHGKVNNFKNELRKKEKETLKFVIWKQYIFCITSESLNKLTYIKKMNLKNNQVKFFTTDTSGEWIFFP